MKFSYEEVEIMIVNPYLFQLEFFKMTDKGLLLTKILELYPVKAEYVRAILDSHKIDEDGSIKAVHFFSKKMFLACTITEYLKVTGNHKLESINIINEVLLYFSA